VHEPGAVRDAERSTGEAGDDVHVGAGPCTGSSGTRAVAVSGTVEEAGIIGGAVTDGPA
jgi:hypothetical protein